MRVLKLITAATLTLGCAGVVEAQLLQQQADARRLKQEAADAAKSGKSENDCASGDPSRESECIRAYNENIKKSGANQKQVIGALNAGNTQAQANNFDGAITTYQGAITAAPGHPNLREIHLALANAYRGRATANFNGAIKPGMTALPPEVISSVSADLGKSLDEAGQAAAMAANDPAKLAAAGTQMRETSRLWASVDRAGLAAAPPRATLDTELATFNTWAATPDATPQKLVQYTPGLALPLLNKDKPAALKLADDMLAKSPNDVDAVIAYGQIVGEAKLPPTDAHRVKAKAAVETTLNTGTTNDAQKVKLRNARIKLNAAT